MNSSPAHEYTLTYTYFNCAVSYLNVSIEAGAEKLQSSLNATHQIVKKFEVIFTLLFKHVIQTFLYNGDLVLAKQLFHH